jgi:hypothetical protein
MSGTLGRIYATCGPRTLARDLNELVSLGLIRLLPDGYAANGEILQNLLPLVVGSDTESSNTVVDL